MYFLSVKGDNGILRLNDDYKEGKASVSLHPVNPADGQVMWKSKAFLSLMDYDMLEIYNQLKKGNSIQFSTKKANSSLSIQSDPNHTLVTHTYVNTVTEIKITGVQGFLAIRRWVKFSVELFPGLASMFHDLLSILQPNYYMKKYQSPNGSTPGTTNWNQGYSQNNSANINSVNTSSYVAPPLSSAPTQMNSPLENKQSNVNSNTNFMDNFSIPDDEL